jgi:hypothetical protein
MSLNIAFPHWIFTSSRNDNDDDNNNNNLFIYLTASGLSPGGSSYYAYTCW